MSHLSPLPMLYPYTGTQKDDKRKVFSDPNFLLQVSYTMISLSPQQQSTHYVGISWSEKGHSSVVKPSPVKRNWDPNRISKIREPLMGCPRVSMLSLFWQWRTEWVFCTRKSNLSPSTDRVTSVSLLELRWRILLPNHFNIPMLTSKCGFLIRLQQNRRGGRNK